MIMSLSGTLVVVLYFLMYPLLEKYIGALWRYRFLKMALMFYLVPLAEVKYHFFTILYHLFGYEHVPMEEHVPQVLNRAGSIMVGPSGQLVYPEIAKKVFIVTLLIACCSFVIISKQVYRYFKVKYMIVHYGVETELSGKVTELLEILRRELKLKKNIKLLLSLYVDEPMVLGIITPVVLLPAGFSEWEEEKIYYILKHEMAHIKNWDLGFKLIGLIVMAVHWFNPFCILLFKELSEMAEICCDKRVIAGRDEFDRKEYGTLLIDMAAGSGKHAGHKLLLSSGFVGNNMKRMKRRIQEMKKRERVGRILSSLVLIMVFQLVFVMAVFAYAPIPKLEVENTDLKPRDVREVFIPGDIDFDVAEDFTMGGVVFVEDKTGTVYNVSETKPRASCDHNYVSGEKQVHVKNSDGSCRIDFYKAQRCSKCGDVKVGDKINFLNYGICPH